MGRQPNKTEQCQKKTSTIIAGLLPKSEKYILAAAAAAHDDC